MKEITHKPGMRELLVRIDRVQFRTVDNESSVAVTYLADNGEVLRECFVMDRDLWRLDNLRWAVGWATLAYEQVYILLDVDGTILGYSPAGRLGEEYAALCKRTPGRPL